MQQFNSLERKGSLCSQIKRFETLHDDKEINFFLVRANSADTMGKVSNNAIMSEDGLILPRKPMNPCLESAGHKDMHRELLFNQKIGKSVLNQKSELQKALEKHKDAQARRETEKEILNQVPELERVIADRARKLMEPKQIIQEEDNKGFSQEFLLARAKLRARNESQ